MRKITTLLMAAVGMLCFQSGVFANTTAGYAPVYATAGGVQGTKLPAHYSYFMADFEGTGRDKLVLMLDNGDVSVHDPISGASKVWAAGLAPGWAGFSNTNHYPIKACDMNGDKKDDLIIFGHEYIMVWYSNGSSLNLARYHYNLGDKRYTRTYGFDERWFPRMVTDVDGDGMCDIVAFGEFGVSVSYTIKLSNGYSTGGPSQDLTTSDFAVQRGGWISQGLYPRRMADVNGDGKKDIVGFGASQVKALLTRARGQTSVTEKVLRTVGFTADNGGWKPEHSRFMVRANTDKYADILGFGNPSLWTVQADVNGNYQNQPSPYRELKAFRGTLGGYSWGAIVIGDINDDGRDDFMSVSNNEMYYYSSGYGPIAGPGSPAPAPAPQPEYVRIAGLTLPLGSRDHKYVTGADGRTHEEFVGKYDTRWHTESYSTRPKQLAFRAGAERRWLVVTVGGGPGHIETGILKPEPDRPSSPTPSPKPSGGPSSPGDFSLEP